ncbi:hypothetical protein [Methylobacterium tarhaniae]|uniref:hypothetical protein n=1 Tax=Methylobacterium tarhaniae TaxID=1187852 RepID=UPI0012EE3AC0|nr:hypothetical protein [Methylobacterium tarhaniae]
MVQRGRIARPSKLPVLAGILDQFVVGIPYDEEHRSWHPKAALVRYASDRGTMWRLWLGSRNLTRSTDLDAGLLLESTTGRRKGGRRDAGIGTVGRWLAGRSGLPDLDVDAIVVELGAARWLSPEGVEVARIDVADEGTGMRQAPAQGPLDAITVVSPFLDAPVPPLEVADDTPDAASPAPLDDADPQAPSLHAKLFNGKATLLVGSANATSRAWEGGNAELLAELRGRAAVTEGLGHLTGSASPVAFADLTEAPRAEPGLREALELLRRRLVGAWPPRLIRNGPAFGVETDAPIPSLPDSTRLLAGLASTDLSLWPEDATRPPLGDVPASRHTDLLRCELRTDGAASAGCSGRPSCHRWTRAVTPWRCPARWASACSRHGCASSCPVPSCGTAAGGATGMPSNPSSPRRPPIADPCEHRRSMGDGQGPLPLCRCSV